MAQPEISLKLFTASEPRTFGGENRKPPYRQVVAVAMGSQEPLWTPRRRAYEAAPESFHMPADMASKILLFFKQHFMGPDARETPFYNCHAFANWIGGRAVQGWLDNQSLALQALRKAHAVQGNLPMGAQGIVGNKDYKGSGENAAWHSVVGLGENNNECLQVDEVRGHMSIDTYENTLTYYRNKHNPDINLYAIL